MEKLNLWLKTYWIVLAFALAKLLVHLLTATHYGLHRDAFLYLAEARHPDWGYFSTPPLTAFMTRLHTLIWGDSVLAVRLLPALIGTLSIFLVGWLIKALKGGTMALTIGLAAYFLSPAFLRPAMLLQPIIFNHLFWLLAAVVIVQMIRKQEPKLVLWMIPVLGLGWMAKYSIVFYGFALLSALIISRQRTLLRGPWVFIALLGGLLVILPNLVWQYQHNWVVFTHMSELQETQLGNVLIKDFLLSQIFMHLPALPVWLGGLIWLVFNRKHRDFRVFAWAFILTLLLIILLRGKFYYTIAAYTILVVFGAIAWEQWTRARRRILAYAVLLVMLSSGLLILPFSLPVYKPERMVEYDRKIMNLGLDVMLKWEDGKVHELPQDYADMVGWDELGEKVWAFYEGLPDSIRAETRVYGEFYGCAGAALYYRPDPTYPDVYSFNDAFTQWIPRKPDFEHLIYIGYSDRVPLYFGEHVLVGTVDHPHFRERGLPIHFGSYPTQKLFEDWEYKWQETRGRFSRNQLID